MNCFSVFGHVVGLALNGLMSFFFQWAIRGDGKIESSILNVDPTFRGGGGGEYIVATSKIIEF